MRGGATAEAGQAALLKTDDCTVVHCTAVGAVTQPPEPRMCFKECPKAVQSSHWHPVAISACVED
jgi:hypothetical protein